MDGIGEPFKALTLTLYLAIPTNAALVVYTFGSLRFLSDQFDVWMFLAIIASIAAFLNRLDTIYPDVPEKTLIQVR